MKDIEVSSLTKTYGKGEKRVAAVNNISFYVNQGEIFGLLGPNGAGKTSTINMMTGLLKPDSGDIKLLGKDPEKDWEFVRNKMNVSTAYYPLSSLLTIRQNLRIFARIYNIKEVEKKICELLDAFELTKLADKQVISLSSGEQTRTSLCKGLLNDPELLFLDECTVGLDPDIAEKTRKIIKEYQKKKNCTILFTSHYMQEVEELCDRIAFMDKGKIIRIETVENLKKEIKKHSVEIEVKANVSGLLKLLKKEKINILSVTENKVVFEAAIEEDKIYKILNKIFTSGFLLDDLHIKKTNT
jgi:ABC-2 type transport system ATP-binding protein